MHWYLERSECSGHRALVTGVGGDCFFVAGTLQWLLFVCVQIKLEYDDKNEYTHSYVLVVKPDNSFEVFMDFKSKSSGSLLDGWDYASKQIDDPEDTKPDDWVEEEKMNDPDTSKPEGYDDIPENIPDPKAEKPEDWDDEDDGDWEAPTISNPDYKVHEFYGCVCVCV